MKIVCSKKGLVTKAQCAKCPEYTPDNSGNKWGNRSDECKWYRYMKYTPKEQKERGIDMVYPDDPRHKRHSKKLDEDKGEGRVNREYRKWPIARSLDTEIKKKKY